MIRRVSGRSMSPTLEPGNIVVIAPTGFKVGSIVLAEINGREVIKRVDRLENDRVYLIGDNRQESTDSRHYGLVAKKDIRGTTFLVIRTGIKEILKQGPFRLI